MKRGGAAALVGVGAFLVVLAGMLRFYAVPTLSTAPVAPETTDTAMLAKAGVTAGPVSVSENVGLATTLFYPGLLAAGKEPTRTSVPLTAYRITRGDVIATAQAGNGITVYESFQSVVDDQGTVVDAGSIRVAFDGRTSVLNPCCDTNSDGADAATVTFSGINPLKFPFGTEQKTYDYFDTTLNKAIPMNFVAAEDIDGLTTYKFEQNIPATIYTTQNVPGSLLGVDQPAVDADRTYANLRTVWVEPTTGSVIKGTEVQKQTLRGTDGSDKVTIIDATLGTSPDSIAIAVSEAKTNLSQLRLLGTIVPLLLVLIGIALIVVGIMVGRRAVVAPTPVALEVPATV